MSATLDLLSDFATTRTPRVRVGWRPNAAPLWDFDLPAIERAMDLLGVTRPVVIGAVNARRRTDGARKRWGGMHHDELANHRITCATWNTPAEASRTIWHELSHAAQSDRGVKGGTTRLRGREYDEDPREREARAAEALHATVGSLVLWPGDF